MTQKRGTGVLLATITAFGYEARTTTMKDMKQEEIKKVLAVETRRRESSYRESKQKNSITTVNSQGKAIMETRGTGYLLEATINKTSVSMTWHNMACQVIRSKQE
jgi:hypothetical protein